MVDDVGVLLPGLVPVLQATRRNGRAPRQRKDGGRAAPEHEIGSGNDLTWHATIVVLVVVLVAGGVGLPFPEDLTLLAAGALAQPGLVRLTDVVLAGFAGVVAADWILYGLGRWYGAGIVGHPRLGRLLGVHRIDAVRGALMRHQARVVFFARFVLGTRIVTFL